MKPLVLLLAFLAVVHSSVGKDSPPTNEPTHEPTVQPTREDETVMFGDIEVKIGAGMEEGIMNPNDALHKLGPILANIYKQHKGKAPPQGLSQFINNPVESLVHEDGSVSVDAVAFGDGSDLQDMLDELAPLGFQVDSTYRHVASGTIPVSSLGDMCDCGTLMFAMPVIAIASRSGERILTGSVTSNGVKAMEADKVLKDMDINGAGVTVGVLSDSYNGLGGAEDDMESGDLPPANRINVLDDDGTTNPTDEGRAMMQIVHDVARGADLAFHTAFGGMARFASGIIELATEAGCKVIVDDVFVTGEPAFQDGIIAQAVDELRDMGVAYFSAITNQERQSYETAFVDSGQSVSLASIEYRLHDFAYGSVPSQPELFETIYLPNKSSICVVFQWDEPFASASAGGTGSTSDLGIFLLDSSASPTIVGSSDAANIGSDPIEIIDIDVAAFLESIGRSSEPGYLFKIAIGLDMGDPPSLLKVTIFSNGGRFIDHPTNSGAGYGHCVASGSAAVGAVFAESTPPFGVNPPLIQPASSAAGTPILFDKNGKRLAEPEIRRQPRFTGPDGTVNTFFPNQDNPFFFGTSAGVAHVAAVHSLMLEADPKLGPRRSFDVLQRTATAMVDPTIPFSEISFDFRTGHGFVNASAAVEEVLALSRQRNLRSDITSEVLDVGW